MKKDYIKDFLDKVRGKKTNQSLEGVEVEVTADNFDLIKSLLKFDDKDDFYFLQIIQRKKDGNDVPAANNGYRTVRPYYIKSVADFEQRRKAIVQLCNQNRARAYINLNVRNMKYILLSIIKEAATLIEEDRCNQGFRILEHCCGITPKKGIKKTWIVDVDTKDTIVLNMVKRAVNMCRSGNKVDEEHYDNVIATIPTIAGYHFITIGFDKSKLAEYITAEADKEFGDERKEYLSDEMITEICNSIKKDNPTLLYFKK